LAIRVLRNNIDYVSALCATEIAQQPQSSVTTVSSFLSSVYFPDDTLRRFFANARDGAQIAQLLIERKQFVKARILSDTQYRRVELYEADAISRLVQQGRPHEQERAFHLLPSEIEDVLNEMLTLISAGDSLSINFTTKVVPLDYCVFSDVRNSVLIDIRSNYDYQTIQGLHVHSEFDFSADLRKEAELMQTDVTTTSNKYAVCAMISNALRSWCGTDPDIHAPTLPKMQKSDFT